MNRVRFSVNLRKIILLTAGVVVFASCTTKKVMEDNAPRFKDINEEYEKVVKVSVVGEPGALVAEADKQKSKKAGKKAPKGAKEPTSNMHKANMEDSKMKKDALTHEPDIEDSEGFSGRRPKIDPFRENEKVVLSVNYFNVVAGDLTISVLPFKNVNDKKAYHFSMNVKSNKMFSLFYAVDDTAETFVDYETMLPLTYTLEGRETARRKEIRTYFDWEKLEATFWEKTISKDDDEEKKRKVVWSIEPFTQNVISAIFYLRAFVLTPGKKMAFRVSDDGKNYVFNGEVLRKENLHTDVGDFDTIVVKPTFQLDGQFKPTGDILFWLTDDERKLPVRIESKIKIGTLVAKLKSLEAK